MNIDDVIAERIAEASRRREAAKQRRATQQAARQAGLTARHRAKLARLDAAEKGFVPTNEPLSNASVRPNESDALNATEPTSRAECGPEGRRLRPPSTPPTGGTLARPN